MFCHRAVLFVISVHQSQWLLISMLLSLKHTVYIYCSITNRRGQPFFLGICRVEHSQGSLDYRWAPPLTHLLTSLPPGKHCGLPTLVCPLSFEIRSVMPCFGWLRAKASSYALAQVIAAPMEITNPDNILISLGSGKSLVALSNTLMYDTCKLHKIIKQSPLYHKGRCPWSSRL